MTHAEFEYELVEALNMLLEDERASVEMEVALASGATEYMEREAISAMGIEDIHFCDQLRSEMERAGLPVTPQINGIVFQVIDAERYDDRLRAFARHQRAVAERASELQESNLDGALRDALEGITTTHDRHTAWIERRADEFAATRALEFGSPGRSPMPAADGAPGAGASMAEVELEVVTPEAAMQQAMPEAPAEVTHEPTVPSAEQPAEAAAPEVPMTEPQPKPRAARAAPRATAPAKSAAKTTTKPKVAKPKATAKSKAAPATTAAPRRARRARADTSTSEA